MPPPTAGPGPPAEDLDQLSSDSTDEVQSVALSSSRSPLSRYIQTEHQQGGFFAMPAPPPPLLLDPALDPHRRRRKKCGACAPCLRRENCGTCANCMNRKTGKQICKLRKCEQLKRRRSEWEVECLEDGGRGSEAADPELAAETVCKVISVDGPRSGGQMEIGSHDRLQEGVLSLELANGVNSYPNDDDTSMETVPQRAGSVPPRQWPSGHCKVSDGQAQQPCWNSSRDSSLGEPVHHAAMEDAHNLVAFSAIAGSLSPSSSSSCPVKPKTAQLYEKFTQEMGTEGAQNRLSAGAPKGSCQPPEDLNMLQTALSQAKDGHKPPNCNCDGPDCPDYLEWLEKKIKLAASEDQGACKTADSAQDRPQSHVQPHPQPYPQMNGGHHLSSQYHQQQQGAHPDRGAAPKPPIPCSPQVLSIAKEKNVSLQTAIAIEALTQLSGTSPQAAGSSSQSPYHSNLHHKHHMPTFPSQPPNGTGPSLCSPGTLSSSSRSQSVPPGLHTSQQALASSEHHRPQSQGQPLHASPLPSSTSPFPGQGKHPGFSPNPQQWQQGSGKLSEQKSPWMCAKSEPQSHYAIAPHSSSDPMSELKQLLGDTSGKFRSGPFKLPVTQQLRLSQNEIVQGQDIPALSKIKQEQDSGEQYHHASSMGNYNMANSQQQQGQHYPGPPLSPGQAAISHSTQAALQQHLHYKRNLFSNHSPGFGVPSPRAPMACQNLKKWWPQVATEGFPHFPVKQEQKEPKKKKSSQASPVIKDMSGMLMGSPLPKPKQIVIKKTKQKSSLPIFMPQSQITVQKTPVFMADRGPTLNSLQPANIPSLPLYGNSTQAAVAGHPAPAQSQVSITDTSMNSSSIVSAVSEKAPVHPATTVASADMERAGSLAFRNTSTTSPLTSTSLSSTSQLPSLTNIDPKYEDLIRQFEAEFGDAQDAPASQPLEDTAAAQQPGCLSQTSPQDPSPTSLRESHRSPSTTTQSDSASHPNDEKMDIEMHESGINSEADSKQASVEVPKQNLQEQPLPVSLRPETMLDKQTGVLADTFNVPDSPLPKRMKIESSGDVTVLSTTCYSEEDTPTKEGLPSSPSLRGFLESPLRYLDTPTKTLLDTPSKDLQAEFPTCTCVEQILEKDEGPYYNHLGSGPTVASIRDLMETRYGQKGEAIRVEKVIYTGKEGKSSRGCPIAKWVIRRSGEKEKLLCLVRERAGHHCENAVIIILIMAWEGVPRGLADMLYHDLTESLTKYGNPTSRRCGLNDDRTCACQGKDPDSCGASFSFGCSWSMYFNGCKYARSKTPRKFRLQGERPEEEGKLRDRFQHLATEVAPLYKKLAPQAYTNQCLTESKAPDCRLGLKEGRPFSGVTACMDFCAHAHKDQHNLYNGCTVVCTLTKEDNREVTKLPEDEQLHVLPLYRAALTDEFGSEEGQRLKMQTGAIQVLQAFRREVRTLPEPAKSCRQRRLEAKKASTEKKKSKLMQQTGQGTEKSVVKAEMCVIGPPQPQDNKAIVKQEVKPNIKKEHFNGSMDGHPMQAADSFNNMSPHPAYYARGGLTPTGHPSAPDPVNSYHQGLAITHNGFYNYPPNALFPRKLRTYEGRNGALHRAGIKVEQEDQKPDIQSLQARLAQADGRYPMQAIPPNQSGQREHSQSRPSSVTSEPSNRGTPIIKQEPVDVPVYEGSTTPGQSRSNTPSAHPAAWLGHKPNGSMVWDGRLTPRQGAEALMMNQEKQQLHQHPQQPPSPYPQQWSPYPGSNALMASPAPSPSLQVPPSPSPSPHHGHFHQGPTLPGTPRPSTPLPGTPQPGISHSGASTPQPSTPGPGTPGPGTPGPATPRHWASPAPSPQPNGWSMGPLAYNPGLKHSTPAGAYPDKMWSKTGESRCSTPLGLQEKAWKSCGGSLAGSTPSPAPEGRLFPDSLQQSDQVCGTPSRAESDAESTRGRGEDDDDEVWSDSEHNFMDPNIGGVAVAPAHGSILIECARRELHATTPLKKPNRAHPTRISLVFYQHKNLNQPMHGLAVWEAKMKLLAERALQRQQEAALLGLSQEDIKALAKKRKWGASAAGASPGPGQTKDKREGPVTRLAPTFNTTSVVTVSPYAFTRLTGPYSYFV